MTTTVQNLTLLSIVLAGYATLLTFSARAETQPVIDRAAVDRLIRAQEQQARALDQLVRVTDRCKR